MANTLIDDAALNRALSQLAQEEAAQLEWDYQQDRLPIARKVIDETFSHHRPEALKIIRRKTSAASPLPKRLLSLAACLALLFAGVYAALKHPPHKDVPIRPLATAPATIQPLSLIPEGWRGNFFPTWLPEGYELVAVEDKLDAQQAVYKNASGDRLIFSENPGSVPFELQGDETASFTYAPINDSTVSLVALSKQQGTFIVWDVNNQTLMVTLSLENQETALAVARSVETVQR